MAEITTIARPYAEAVFKSAQANSGTTENNELIFDRIERKIELISGGLG